MTPTMTEPKPLLLHEAIRLGAMNSPQHFGGEMNTEGRCALAAAADACGLKPVLAGYPRVLTVPYEDLWKRFPVLNASAQPPVPTCAKDVSGIIYCLNDTLKWSRERIADWLQPIEEAFIASQQPVNVSTPQAVPVGVLA